MANIIYKNKEEMLHNISVNVADIEEDNHGQVVIYTSIFRWEDGTYRDMPDPNHSDE